MIPVKSIIYLFYFRYEATSDNLNITAQCTGDYGFLNSTGGFSRFSRMEQLLIQPKRSIIVSPAGPTTGIESHNLGKEMKRSAFRVFSALAASDEDIRKKVISLFHPTVLRLHLELVSKELIKSFGGQFACLCQEFDYFEVKKIFYF